MKAHAPAEVLQSRVEHLGATYALTLIVSVFTNEGSALLERLPSGNAVHFVQNGEWRKQGADDAPATLSVDFDDSGDIDGHAELLDKLMYEISRTGLWGIEAYQPLGQYS